MRCLTSLSTANFAAATSKIRIGDVVSGETIRNRSTVIQQKTGRPVQFEIMSEARKSLTAWLERRRGSTYDFLFPSRVDYLDHMSTRHVDEWVQPLGLTDGSMARIL